MYTRSCMTTCYPYYVAVPCYSSTPFLNNWNSAQYGLFQRIELADYGPNPYVVNINEATQQNERFRTTLWTGSQLQVTLMALNPGESIGLEMHPDVDQFLRIEQGQGVAEMGPSKDHLHFRRAVQDDSAILVPAGVWHNLTNTGNVPLKLYSIYAPPEHPFGTNHATKQDEMAAHERYGPS